MDTASWTEERLAGIMPHVSECMCVCYMVTNSLKGAKGAF